MLRGRDPCGNGQGARPATAAPRRTAGSRPEAEMAGGPEARRIPRGAPPRTPPEPAGLGRPAQSFGVATAVEAALAGLAAKNV